MSRIHEALKKAEQERAATQTADELATPAEPAAAAPPWEAAMSGIASDATPLATHAPASRSDYLRFDDLRSHCAHPPWELDPNMNVFAGSETGNHAAESFRTLRSRLYQLRSTQSLRTLLVTSAISGEGKTFLTSNLAQAIVRQPDRRALLIDADLRCPRLHVPLGAPSSPGLTDYLRGEADEMAVIQQGLDGNLCFVACGKDVTNPSELLCNGGLKKLLDRVTPVFDWVILDSPPCLPVADASIVAELCDGVLLVVRAGSTPSEVAQKACQQLEGKKVVGVALNAVDEIHLYGSYYYQSYGYSQNGSKASHK
jgi:protein-tyrosine kinase